MLSYNNDEKKCGNARYNGFLYGVKNNLEFIKGNFNNSNFKRKFDLVFINTNYNNCFTNEENVNKNKNSFSIFKHISPDLRQTINISLKISDNIQLILPKFTNISELAILFNEQLNLLNL